MPGGGGVREAAEIRATGAAWVTESELAWLCDLAASGEVAVSGGRQTWYFTFGWGQQHANRFFVVKDATYEQARERMFNAFGREWGFQYDEAQWVRDGVSQAEEYGLTEIK